MAYRKVLYRGKLSQKQTMNTLPKNPDEFAPHGWVTGYYCADCPDTIFGNPKHNPHIIATGNPDKVTTGMWWAVDEQTVGEYTGFDDSDGTPIFEGDIVTLSFAPDTLYAVIWAQEQARFLFTDGETVEDFDDFYVFETKVVGNIYDNPDIAPRCEV